MLNRAKTGQDQEYREELHSIEQDILFKFTDKLYRAETIDQILEAALDAITTALACERAAVLLFGPDGVMRFAVWRGLSDACRKAVERHSPWNPGDINPQPIFIADFAESSEQEELKSVIRHEGIGALAFIPVASGGTIFGMFMSCHREPRVLSRSDVSLAVTIGRQLGFAIERDRSRHARRLAEQALRQSERRLRSMFEQAGVGIVLMGSGGTILRANAAYASIARRPLDELIGTSCLAFTHPNDLASDRATMQRLSDGADTAVLESRYVGGNGEPTWVRMTLSLVDSGEILAVVEDVSEQVQAEQHRTLLINELNHRVKNTLATVQAIAMQTFRGSSADPVVVQRFESRILALSNAHDILTSGKWEGADLQEIIVRTLQPYALSGRLRISGPRIVLSPKAVVALAMGVHELATNAAKYGALSNDSGLISVSWTVSPSDTLALEWKEQGGPPVTAPSHKGFGSRLIERNLPHDLDGIVSVDYLPDGLAFKLISPLKALVA
ncbi:MAG TPA: HWE histidine kinase domain-containing protein [Dongiaceae bacterium]